VEFWKTIAGSGDSPLSAARRLIVEDTTVPYHHSKAWLIEVEGEVAGGLIGGPVTAGQGNAAEIPDYMAPLLALEAAAEDHWAIIGIAVYPEFRGRGLARRLLEQAEVLGRAVGASGLSLVVEDSNEPALMLYRSLGFRQHESRGWLVYANRSGPKEWLLLVRSMQQDDALAKR
jgi:ribosomal protein S18 acetylase RimI-like enzyme